MRGEQCAALSALRQQRDRLPDPFCCIGARRHEQNTQKQGRASPNAKGPRQALAASGWVSATGLALPSRISAISTPGLAPPAAGFLCSPHPAAASCQLWNAVSSEPCQVFLGCSLQKLEHRPSLEEQQLSSRRRPADRRQLRMSAMQMSGSNPGGMHTSHANLHSPTTCNSKRVVCTAAPAP